MSRRPGDHTVVDARSVAFVVRSCPFVVGLHAGRRDRIATTVGDVRIVGVCVQGNSLVLGVIGRDGHTTDDIAAQVRAVLSERAPGYQVTVSVRRASEISGVSAPRDPGARSADPADR